MATSISYLTSVKKEVVVEMITHAHLLVHGQQEPRTILEFVQSFDLNATKICATQFTKSTRYL